jgi:tRNA A-37 threonylcarbamoyl transferase component Bud32/tetratricopeptide (TPR) repeat protein
MVAAISIEASADEDEVLPGDLVGGRYRLGDMLGRGAMGEVLRAHDTHAGRDVAIKRFRLASDRADDRLRFRREFHTLARLRHPRIVEAYDYGVDDTGQPFYTMELLDGRDLGTMAPLPWRDACPLLRDVAAALAFLHTRQLLHRDVAPRNVRCTSDGRAKLLDFGMLSTMGVSSEIVGTLPSIAPEMILGLPMDRRADLFGLGALAFWLLTGRHPQRVRNLDDLVRNGRKPPPPPSRIERSIPPELDDLVLSLLSPEPLGRPDNATEVIERLTSIAGLEAAPELDAARGYVRSAELVGRGREMDIVRKRLERAVKGQGSSLLVEGRAGMGKTRLLREIELEAKLAGALVLRGEGDLGGPYALVRKLARELELGVRGGVVGNSGPHGALIDRLLHTRRETRRSRKRLEQIGEGSVDHREERLALQAGLSDFISTFATHRPLVVLVDNLQRADEGSTAVLAALAHLAHERMLLLVGAVNPTEDERTDGALGNLRERALVLRTRGLDETGVRRLVRAMFGEAPGLATLAQWMHRIGGGSPLLCTELARHLVDRGVIRFLDGMWVIPDQMPAEGLPLELEQAMDARVEGLSVRARALAQAIAVLGREAGLARCVELLPGVDELEVFAAIDELVREEIVIGSEERYRLRHDGLRDALLRGLAPHARADLDLRVGRILAAAGAGRRSPEHEAQTGWHFLRGGERRQGAELLFRAGERLFAATSFEDCVAPLEAALEVWQAEDIEARRRAQILYMLVAAGFYVDRDVNVRHSRAALAVFSREANVDLARSLRVFGPKIAFALAFTCGWLLSLLHVRRAFGPVEALELYLRCAVYTAGVAGFSFDTAELRACAAALEPLRTLPHPGLRNGYGLVDNLLNFNLGRQGTVLRHSDESLKRMETLPARVTDEERALSIGGARFQRGLVFVRNGSPEALAEIERLERLGPRIWAIGALQLRTFWHMWRGESAQARRVWAGAELEFVRLGALWQMHAIQHSTACITSAFSGDVLGLKRSIEALARQVENGLCFHGHLLVAQGEYQRIGGDTEKAIASIEEGLSAMPDGEGLARPWGLTARAQALLDAEDFDRAVLAADEAFAFCRDPDRAQHAFAFRAGRIRALARAGLGHTADGLRELADLVQEAEATDNPFLAGMLHEARALVALRAGDRDLVRRHCERVEHLFVPTRNPVLVARYDKLLRQCGLGPTPDPADSNDVDLATEVFDPDPMGDTVGQRLDRLMSLLSQCETAIARSERALEALVDAAGAQQGYLYLLRGEDFELVAPAEGAEPPPEVSSSLHDRLQAALATSDDFTTLALRKSHGWRTVLLHAERASGTRIVVGAAVLFASDDAEAPAAAAALRMPPASVRDAIGQRLYDEGDVYTTAPGSD